MGLFGTSKQAPADQTVLPAVMPTATQAITIPENARQRLEDMRGTGGKRRLWSSDLSVDELLVLKALDFKAAGLVMGSAVFHIGNQTSNWKENMELPVLSEAMYNVRETAMERMRMEAEALGACGIVGVRFERNDWGFAQDSIEFMAIGTAVYHPDAEKQREYLAPDGKPFTSTLSGQNFYKLMKAGHRPVCMVMGNCVYHVAHRGMWEAIKQDASWRNSELKNFTTALYGARELAQVRIDAEAEAFKADGIVDLSISHGTFWGESHIIEFFAIGTACKELEGDFAVVEPTLVLGTNE